MPSAYSHNTEQPPTRSYTRSVRTPFPTHAEDLATCSWLPHDVEVPPIYRTACVSASVIARISIAIRIPANRIISSFLPFMPFYHSRLLWCGSSYAALPEFGNRRPREARMVPNRRLVIRSVGLNPRIRHLTAEQAPPSMHQGLPHISHLDGNQKSLAA
jgi:hypothetical protein